MFPEYRDLITQLKNEGDNRFLKLFEKHNLLDHQVDSLIKQNASDDEVNRVKKEKLAIKDEIHLILKQKAQSTKK